MSNPVVTPADNVRFDAANIVDYSLIKLRAIAELIRLGSNVQDGSFDNSDFYGIYMLIDEQSKNIEQAVESLTDLLQKMCKA